MSNELQTIFNRTGGLDPKTVEFLAQALDKNNLPGFDYIEFLQALDKLSQMQIDEATAFRSAFATASTVGLTKEKLLETAAHYKQVLIDEKQKFDLALQNQQDQRVANKLKEIADLKEQIKRNEEMIKRLQDEISKSQATVRDTDFVIEKEIQKIESTKNNFLQTHQSILAQIDKDIDNINKYL